MIASKIRVTAQGSSSSRGVKEEEGGKVQYRGAAPRASRPFLSNLTSFYACFQCRARVAGVAYTCNFVTYVLGANEIRDRAIGIW